MEPFNSQIPDRLGVLLETFVNQTSHPRGRALAFMAGASITLPQVILLNFAAIRPGSTPSSLATTMKISAPSVSQMIERLVKLGYAVRIEDPADRRSKTIEITDKARTFLAQLKAIRIEEYTAGTARLSPATRAQLSAALEAAVNEFLQAD